METGSLVVYMPAQLLMSQGVNFAASVTSGPEEMVGPVYRIGYLQGPVTLLWTTVLFTCAWFSLAASLQCSAESLSLVELPMRFFWVQCFQHWNLYPGSTNAVEF
ncbi:hypothetical protein DSO57_1001259 [Entomophthora muscae]|uniref:Uncharacterized protein n=1 Tax=Entomophthora muscae TaxID=34485 RepID=A0ACC2SLX4_9FUNG|nr:hypothetical protein DSO57_1001259 [Entomophthora muscae]